MIDPTDGQAFEMLCAGCGSSFAGSQGLYACPRCGSRLEAVFSYERRKDRLREVLRSDSPRGIWRYRELLPVQAAGAGSGSAGPAKAGSGGGGGGSSSAPAPAVITIGEGDTPLVEARRLAAELGVAELNIKYEGSNPTGTFKDRCMAVALTKVLEFGGGSVVLGSAGNAAAAAAAYSARAGVACHVFVPSRTPRDRVVQTMSYGANVFLVRGTVNDCIDLIARVQSRYGWHNATTAGCYNPYQAEAPKTIGYEIAAHMGWEVPDWIFAPVGGGGLLAGVWKAYQELYLLGLTNGLPRMVGVQAAGCAPLVRAFERTLSHVGQGQEQRQGRGRGRDRERERESTEVVIDPWGEPDTVAAAIADPYPLDGELALRAIRESHGCAVSVPDDEILRAQKLLATREGIFAEPASATTLAALMALREGSRPRVQETARVVCIVTGTGLKDIKLAGARLSASPPEIGPDEAELEQALKASRS